MKYPILTYHKVSEQWELSFTMMYPAQFEKQMRYLADKGYKGKNLKEYLRDPKEKDFVITFDDAYESVYHFAFPVLNELGFRASVFVPTKYIGEMNTWDFTPGNIHARHMNEEQLRDLHMSGWEIASHGEDHRAMTGLPVKTAVHEMSHSKVILESLINENIETFCFPFGVYNKRLIRAARDAGYRNLVGFTGHSRHDVITRSVVYRVVDNPKSVLRKIRVDNPCHFTENMKEAVFHSFALMTRLKQKLPFCSVSSRLKK